ncbi:MAG: quinol dehydrogenase ferredoxin subunit NapH [Gammaproteobacteria bacterium]|nr:quinol dehydrogenase ferredoxin subunit NapH [Gammaproteobacteria bacterium]MDH5653262.1 quinol dehydrogenase ferredoxin subunit NapH [Gammaproteobacteria bacterium]
MSALLQPGAEAIAHKGRLRAHQWLLLRRSVQLAVLGLFLSGPLLGVWIIKGNIASSLTLDTLPLSDPFLVTQSLFAGHRPETTLLIGAALVAVFYFLVGGRVYCSWICPINMITDLSAWLRQRLHIKSGLRLQRETRYWLLAMSLIAASISGSMVWELINPVTTVYRGLIFGMGGVWLLIMGLFLFDLFISPRGWCSHLCPMGAFYSLAGRFTPVRISAVKREQCNDCMDCYAICPEPQVIPPALKGAPQGRSPVITGSNCTNCGRCIDVCSKEVFRFTSRFYKSTDSSNTFKQSEVLS